VQPFISSVGLVGVTVGDTPQNSINAQQQQQIENSRKAVINSPLQIENSGQSPTTENHKYKSSEEKDSILGRRSNPTAKAEDDERETKATTDSTQKVDDPAEKVKKNLVKIENRK